MLKGIKVSEEIWKELMLLKLEENHSSIDGLITFILEEYKRNRNNLVSQ